MWWWYAIGMNAFTPYAIGVIILFLTGVALSAARRAPNISMRRHDWLMFGQALTIVGILGLIASGLVDNMPAALGGCS